MAFAVFFGYILEIWTLQDGNLNWDVEYVNNGGVLLLIYILVYQYFFTFRKMVQIILF